MAGAKGRLSKSMFQITKLLALFFLTQKILKSLRKREKKEEKGRQHRNRSSVMKSKTEGQKERHPTPNGVLRRTEGTGEDP